MDERLNKYETKMQKSLDNLGSEYGAIRAGRANPHILDRVMVDYYGTPTPVAQVGNIAIPEARIITITPWGEIFFSSASAICTVSCSCICGRLAYTSTVLASLLSPTTLPSGI